MTFHDLTTFYHANRVLVVAVGVLAGVGLLLMAARRLKHARHHRVTLLAANVLTVLAAALATMVSASGMWKVFTDILGPSPLRIVFFAFLEVALLASALLARSRLLREPDNGSTGIDGIAVWTLAALTATLSALDSDSFREVCLRLAAPLVAAWMWERALAAERQVRLGATVRRIDWTLTAERILIRLRLAQEHYGDMSDVDRVRRRAKLGRARLHLHLLQSRNTFAWRVRHAHRAVIKQAMQAAEHIGLADHPDAASEREAIQMYMATLYGFVEATSPQAVAHLHAWQTTPPQQHHVLQVDGDPSQTPRPSPLTIDCGRKVGADGGPGRGDETNLFADCATDNGAATPAGGVSGAVSGAAAGPAIAKSRAPGNGRYGDSSTGGSSRRDGHRSQPAANGRQAQQPSRAIAHSEPTHQLVTDGREATKDIANHQHGDTHTNSGTDLPVVEVMRRFWYQEVSQGRVPTGAELSRAAGVPPSTGLGRRKRRIWKADLPEHLMTLVRVSK